ncbi:CYTH domain-containing protein [Polaribacter marinivivus]|mgnify:FL=1|jgi:adenylate cyclase|uniref:CYTH domain-containing protein n=1 Tax=Polaribacter TaxID=52959 RepID=UPI003D33DEAA
MNIEIERKFLVKNKDFKNLSYKEEVFKQGYLNSDKTRNVRIRVTNDKAFLTIKGASNASGTTRFEWEKEINRQEAEQLLLLCEPTIIEKKRYYIKNDDLIFEVDEFYADNQGLILAEIELNSEHQKFKKPDWLGKEVTGNKEYYNSYLSKNPFKSW